ncbi:MAG TPA: hypothetical protein VE992_00375, partial [Solirubrobacteraceae bacterium]|nr:hypothetical protein [Solirubrobacteraceae bacterium]
VVPQFLVGFQLPSYTAFAAGAGALAAFGLVMALWRGDALTRRRTIAVAGLALGGLVLNLVLIAGGVDDLLTRNLIALWLPAALAVSAGLGARRTGVGGLLAAAALCAIGITSAVAVDVNRDYQRPDWRGVARLLGPRPAPGVERVILIQHYRDLLPLSLYLPGLRFLHHWQVAHARELDVVSFTSPPSGGFCWWGPACNLWPSQMQASFRIPGFHAVWRRHVYQFTVLRMVADRPEPVTMARAGLALSSPRVRARWELLVQR